MNSLKLSSVAFALGLIFTAPSHANAVLSISPDTQSVNSGSTATFDINISGLVSNFALAAYDVNIGFDPTLLSFNQVTFGDPVLGDQLDPTNSSLTSPLATPGTSNLDLNEFSFLDANTLNTLQASSFTLAVVTFNTLAAGTSDLTFLTSSLSDVNGNTIPFDTLNGSVTIGGNPNGGGSGGGTGGGTVPEPDVLWLVLGGGLALRLNKHRR